MHQRSRIRDEEHEAKPHHHSHNFHKVHGTTLKVGGMQNYGSYEP